MLYKMDNSHGGDIYRGKITLDYSANINPFGTPEAVRKAICKAAESIDRYPDPYCEELILNIAAYEKVNKDFILCGNGAAELIYSYFEALKPKKAAETAPTFSEYSAAAEKVGCEVIRYKLLKDNGFKIDEGILSFLEKEKPDIFVLCNPNNPTGRLAEPVITEKILDCCVKNKIRLFADECFLDFTKKGVSLKSRLEEYKGLFILKAFTKNYAMAGARLGYCMSADEELLKKMSGSVQPWNVSGLAQRAGVAALSETDFLEKTREYIITERKRLSESLEGLGFYVCPSDANFVLFYGRENLAEKLKEKGIAVRDCAGFKGLEKGWYRVAVRLHEDNLKLINNIKEICEE